MIRYVSLIFLLSALACQNNRVLPNGTHPRFVNEISDTYVINMQHNTERLALFTKAFSATGLAFKRFEAIVGTTDLVNTHLEHRLYVPDTQIRKTNLTPGEMGNFLSHASIFKHAAESHAPMTLVFEDRARVKANFAHELQEALTYAPNDWDLLYLGCNSGVYCHPEGLLQTQDGRFAKLNHKCVAGNYAYLVSEQGAQKLHQHLYPIRAPTDEHLRAYFFSNQRIEFNAYCTIPELARVDQSVQSEIDKMGRAKARARSHSN